jgi:anti-sigma regulatory factor (Ser/Thr protein kinase)
VGLALSEATRTTLALLVTELVTNAVRHAGLAPEDSIRVEIANGKARVRATVHDGGPGFVPARVAHGAPLEPGLQGLLIVAALADTWGIDRDAGGCSVWCELAVDDEPATEIAAGVEPLHDLALEMARMNPTPVR